jgi:hypothetical protein
MYRYVRNNPPNGTDSSGLAPNLPPQGVQPSSSKPESMIGGPAGSIICQDGNPEVWISDYFKDDNSQECGITECIFAHEGFHLQDALGEGRWFVAAPKERGMRRTVARSYSGKTSERSQK